MPLLMMVMVDQSGQYEQGDTDSVSIVHVTIVSFRMGYKRRTVHYTPDKCSHHGRGGANQSKSRAFPVVAF